MLVKAMKALAVALGVTSLAGLAGCRDSGNDSNALTASEHKYCTLVKQFKEHLPNISKDAAPEQFAAEMSASMTRNNKYFEDLLKVAPAEIKPDVEAAIAALRRVATGDITAYEGLNLTKADEWEEAHCNQS
jgi:O6-methylguanine-DNA--protein-cysteine methyltransferase